MNDLHKVLACSNSGFVTGTCHSPGLGSKKVCAETQAFDQKDIQKFLDHCQGNAIFDQSLRRIETHSQLIVLLLQYVQFNSIFGAGVANLAGELACRKDVFQDDSDRLSALADRSHDVASTVFYAAIDEFGRNKTHRSMAQDTLRGAACFFDFTDETINELAQDTPALSTALKQVASGYCLSTIPTTSELFRGIGFHIGSELLADQEFNILHAYLNSQQKDLVDYLQSRQSYSWVNVHTTVEAEHFTAALETANRAVRYFDDKVVARNWILEGLWNFVLVQQAFMKSLLLI